MSEKILMATIGAPHGVSGQVRVKSYTGDPLALGDYGPLYDEKGTRYDVKSVRPSKTVLVVNFKQLTNREAAEAVKGLDLYIDRSQLPDDALDDDEFFVEDLIGLACVDETGQPFGNVVAVHNFGADDIIEIRYSANGKTEMYPFTMEVVPEIDFNAKQLVLIAPSEIFVRQEEADGEEDEA